MNAIKLEKMQSLQRVLNKHGIYTALYGLKIDILDKSDNIIDTVEIVSGEYNKTIIKTTEYESISLLEWLGY